MHAHIGFYIIFLMTLSLVGVHKNGPITPSPTLLLCSSQLRCCLLINNIVLFREISKGHVDVITRVIFKPFFNGTQRNLCRLLLRIAIDSSRNPGERNAMKIAILSNFKAVPVAIAQIFSIRSASAIGPTVWITCFAGRL